MIWVAFDVGGTFTGIVLHDAAAQPTHVTKVPTLPRRPAAGVVEGIQEVLDGLGRRTRDITRVLYGTTLATNDPTHARAPSRSIRGRRRARSVTRGTIWRLPSVPLTQRGSYPNAPVSAASSAR